MGKLDEKAIDINSTAIVESSCDKVPDVLNAREKCMEEASKIVAHLINNTVTIALDPAVACGCLGACDSTAAAPKVDDFGGSLSCTVCEAAQGAVDEVLTLNATQEALVKSIDAACDTLPLSSVCKDLLSPEAVNGMLQCELTTALAPEAFCTSLGHC